MEALRQAEDRPRATAQRAPLGLGPGALGQCDRVVSEDESIGHSGLSDGFA
jgi:hypothetical protein